MTHQSSILRGFQEDVSLFDSASAVSFFISSNSSGVSVNVMTISRLLLSLFVTFI